MINYKVFSFFIIVCFISQSFNLLSGRVTKKILSNGLTVLVKKTENTQPVTVQLWYNVGSKHEKDNQKGMAHWLEHMTFKGTKSLLSESDIPMIAHKLSGNFNAATSFDWTYYTFDMPLESWHEVLPILADCMSNCTFKQDLLNSELKVVIQELKMNRDNNKRSLLEKMLAAIFADHPYHHPVIGYKHNLWNLSRKNMMAFYKQHYIPNNAVLVIVGNVDTEAAIKKVSSLFEKIPSNENYEQSDFYLTEDIQRHTVKLYRDIKQPYVMLAFVVPGLKNDQNPYFFNVLSLLLTDGKRSSLYKKLVEELELVTSINSFTLDLFDHDIFFINYKPKFLSDNKKIISIIHEEIQQLSKTIDIQDIENIIKILKHDQYHFLQNNHNQASQLGELFLAQKGEEDFLSKLFDDFEPIVMGVKSIIQHFLRHSRMHKGLLLPLPEDSHEDWKWIKKNELEEEAAILGSVTRISEIEEGKYVNTVKSYEPLIANVVTPERLTLSNGVKVFYKNNSSLPIISLILTLKADSSYESQAKPGIYSMVCNYLQEGTKSFTAQELAHQLESNAIFLSINPGFIHMEMLKEDLPKALHILYELLNNATFEEKSFAKIRNLALADYYAFLDNPHARVARIVAEHIYENHPFGYVKDKDEDALESITREDIISFYRTYFSPYQANLAIVGDFDGYNIEELLDNTIASWQGPEVSDLVFPSLEPVKEKVIIEHIKQDQVILQFAGLSVARTDPDFDKLLIFDYILCNGMNSHLFKLRQKYGIFYTIFGSLISMASQQPGMALIKTIISKDKVDEVVALIQKTIKDALENLNEEEIMSAKRVILNEMASAYSTNYECAETFLFLNRYNFADDYLAHRKEGLNSYSLEEIRQAAARILNKESMVIVQAGNF